MSRKRTHKRYELENLEPRILLSGDPLVGAVAALAPGDPDSEESALASTEEVLGSEESNVYDPPSADSESYDPSEPLDDIFSGLTGDDVSSDEAEEPAGGDETYDTDRPIGNSEEAQILLGLTELVRLGERVELSEALAAPLLGLGDASLGELVGLVEILDSRLAKSVYDYFGDAVDPPTGEGILQALSQSLNTLGDLGIKVSSLEGGFVSAAGELRFDVAFTASREGQLLLGDEETGSDQPHPADYVATLELDISFGVDLDRADGFFLAVRSFTLGLTVSTTDGGGSEPLAGRVDVGVEDADGDGRVGLGELQAINAGSPGLEIRTAGSLFDTAAENIAPSVLATAIEGAEAETSGLVLDGGLSGNSAATTNLAELDLGPGSTTVIEIGGTTAGTQYDQIIVAGNADLGGTLDIDLTSGFSPAVGDIFEVITYGSATGSFASFTDLNLGGGLELVPIQGPGSLLLIAVPDIAAAAGLLVAIQAELDKYINGTNTGDLTISLGSVQLDGFLQLLDLSLIFTGITHNGTNITAGSVTVEAGSALLFPGQPLFIGASDGGDGDALALSGTYDPVAETFSLVVDQLDVIVAGVFTAHADTVTVTYDPNDADPSQTLVTIGSADVIFQGLADTTATVSNLTIRKDGFSAANATVAAPDITWIGVFELTGLTLTFANLDYSTATQALAGTITVSATTVSLFETVGPFSSTVTGFTGSYDLQTKALSLSATSVDLDFGATLQVNLQSVAFDMDPGAETFRVSTGLSTATVAGFVGISGNFGLASESGDILVVADTVTATLDAGVFEVGVTGGTLALIVKADETVALQASGGLVFSGGNFANASATSVTVKFNNTGANVDTTVTVGAVSAPLQVTDGTTAVTAVGVSVDLAGFVTFGGDFGFEKSGTTIIASADQAFATLVAGPFAVGVTGGSLALILNDDGTLALQASGGLTFSGGNFANASATSVTVKYNDTGADVNTTVAVGAVSAPLQVTDGTTSVEVVGLQVDLAGFVTFGGDFGFEKSGTTIRAAGAQVFARLEAGPFAVGVTGGSLALILNDDGTLALQAGGTLVFSGGNFASPSATSVTVRFNDTGTNVDTTVVVGAVSAPLQVTDGTTSVEIVGLQVDLAGFVTFGGDFGFEKSGTTIRAAADQVSATMVAGPFSVGVTGGTLALILNDDGTLALQAGGSLTFTGGNFANASATSVTVKFNDTGANVDTTVVVGAVSAPLQVTDGTTSVEIVGLQVDLAGFVTFGGDFGFEKSGTTIVAAADQVSATLAAGPFAVGVTGGTLALILNDGGTLALQASGGLAFSGGNFANASATSVTVKFNDTGANVDTTVTVGAVSAPLQVTNGTTTVTAVGVSVDLAGFVTFGGDFGFEKSGSTITAAADQVFATLGAGPFAVGVTGGTLALILNDDGTLALQAGGSLTFTGGNFANASATSVTVKFNDTGANVDTSVTVGAVTAPLQVTDGTTSVEVIGLQVDLAGFVTFGGDFGFEKSGTTIRAAADQVFATLGAGPFAVGVTGGALALILNDDGTLALQAGGSLTFTGGSFANASATSVTVRFNDTGANVDTTVAVGAVSAPLQVTDGTTSVEIAGLQVDLAGLVTFGGDFGFQKSGSTIIAAADQVFATLEAGPFAVGVTGGTLALILNDGGTLALQAGGSLVFSGGSFANASATSVTVRFNDTGANVDTTVAVGAVSAPLQVTDGTTSVEVVGLQVDLAGFVTFGGDFGFEKSGSTITAAADQVFATLEAGPFAVGVTGGTLALILNDGGTLALQASGGLTFSGGNFANPSATSVTVRFNDTGANVDTTVTVGAVSAPLQVTDGTTSVEVVGLSVDLAGFVTFGGDFAFQKTGAPGSETIIAAADQVSATMGSGSFGVGVTGGTLGLILNPDGTLALQAGGALFLTAGDFANASATSVTVRFNDTGANIDTTVTVGAVSAPLQVTDGVTSVEVLGLSVDVAGFLTLSGNLGFSRAGANIHGVGDQVTARMEVDPTVYVELANAEFGLIAGPGTFAFELKNGALTIALGPLGPITSTAVLVQFTAPTTTVTAGTALSVGSLNYTFDNDIALNTVAFAVFGLNVDVASVFTLTGDLGFKKSGLNDIVVVGNNVTVRLEVTPSVYVELANAEFGLISGLGKFAFELKNGALTIALGPITNITATAVFVQFSGPTTTVSAATTIAVGPLSYTFDNAIATSTVAFALQGFSFDIGGVFSLSGDLGFKKSGTLPEIVAVGNNVTVRLEVTPSVYVELAGAEFGLISGTGKFAFEMKNGALTLALGPITNITASSVFVQFSGPTTTVTSGKSISVGPLSYTFDNDIAVSTVAFALQGFSFDIGGVFSLSGDLGFKKSGTLPEIVAVGNNVTVRLEVTPSVYVELAGAEFGLISGTGKFAFEMKNGALTLALGPITNITASSVFVQFSGPTTTVTSGKSISVGPLSYTFDNAIAVSTVAFALQGFSFDIGVFSLSGDLGFKKSGTLPEIVAVGNNVTVRLEATSSVYVELANADFGLISGSGKFVFEMKNGSLDLQLGPIANITAVQVFVQFSNPSPTSTVSAGTTIAVGPVSYTFDQAIVSNTIAFAVVGLDADIGGVFSLSGDIGFKKSGVLPEILAVGNNVTVRLEATSSVYVELANAEFGLIAGSGKFVFEMKNGSLDLQLGPIANITAVQVFVQFSNPNPLSTVSAGTTISVGPVSYTFDETIVSNTIAFAVVGLNADIGGVFSLSGDIGFKKSGVLPEILAVGNNVTVRLEATSSVYAELANADFGLIAGSGKLVFEMKNGSLDLQLGPLANITAVSVFVQFSSPNPLSTVSAGTTIAVGPVNYTFDQAIASNTIAFAVVGLSADIGGVFSISGDVGFKKSGLLPEIIGVGNNVTVRLEATSSVYVELANADFGLVAGSGKFGFEMKNGVLDVQLAPLANVTATDIFVQFTSPTTLITAGTTIAVGPVSYTFDAQILPNTIAFAAVGLDANVGGVLTITGDLGFSKSLTLIKVVANNLTARLAVGSVSVEVANASFGLKAGLENGNAVFAFELKDGTLNVDLSPVGTLNVTRIFVQVTGPTTTITAGDIIQIGPAQYVFGSDIAASTIAIFVEGNLQLGTGGFRLDGTFEFVATPSFVRLLVIASMNMAPLNGQLLVSGDLRISDAGIVGGLALGGQLTLGPLTIVGAFTLEVNSTTSQQTVQRFVFDSGTETFAVDGAGTPITQSVAVAAGTVRLFAFAKIKLAGSFTLEGSVTFENTPTHVALDVDMSMQFFSVQLRVVGAARIVKTGSTGLVLNLGATLSASAFGVSGIFDFSADLRLQLNTRGGTGSDANDLGVPRQTFRVEVTNATLTLLGFITLNGSGFVQFSQGVFSMQVSLSGNFLNLVTMSGSAFFSSEGEFEVILDGGIFLGVTGFNVSGSAHIEVSLLDSNGKSPLGTGTKVLNIAGSATASATIFFIPIGPFTIGFAYNSGTGDITISVGPVPVPGIEWVTVDLGFFGSARIPYPTITFKSFSFTIGRLKLGAPPPPPVLGFVNSGGRLTLNVGPRAVDRNLQEGEIDEGVIIEGVGPLTGGRQTIRVSMFGVTQVSNNVADIMIEDMAAGNDFVEVASSVAVPIEAHLGGGADIFNSAGSGVVTVHGDVGDDRLQGGSAADHLFGGPGSDEFTGRAGADTISGGNDGDRVNWNVGDGNDSINDTGTGGSDQVIVFGTFNPDQMTISGSGAGFTVAVGAETLVVNGVELAELDGGDGGDTFTINNLTSTLSVNLLLGAGAADTVTFNGSAGPEAFDLSTAVASRPVVVGGVPTVSNVNVFRLSELGAATVDVIDASAGDTVTLGGGGGNDVINVRSLRSGLPTTVNGGGGADTINVGTNALGTTSNPSNNSGGNLNKIAALLTVNGNGGGDTLNVDDGVDGAGNTGVLTATAITQLGMGGSITYGTVQTLTIGLGSGGDGFTIQSTHGGTTNLNTNNGADTVHVNSASGILNVVGGNGTDTFNVNATNSSSVSTLNGSGDADTFNVHAMNGQVTVNAGGGSDTVNVGSLAPGTGGNVNAIAGHLTVNGNGSADTLNVDDTGDGAGNTGQLTNTTITGLGMGGSITYGTVETLNIGLGSGGDVFTIQSTHGGTTNLNGNGGADITNIRTISGTTTVGTGAGADTINVGSNAQGNSSDPDNNAGGTLNGIDALLTITGGGSGGDRDSLTVDDTADAAANTGILTSSRLTGLGMGNPDQSVVAATLGISYSQVEDLVISLGTGADTFTINGTHNGATAGTTETTTLNTGAGTDLVHINDVSDTLVVNGEADVDTINVNGTGTGSVSTLNGDAGADIFNVRDMDGRVNVRGGADSDTVNVTDIAPTLPTGARTTQTGSIDEINALLDVDGGTGPLDVMNVDDSRAAAINDKTGTLTATTLRGLELDVGIDYLGLEELNIWLGFGDNTFDINSTHPGETTLNTAEGEDTVNVNNVSGLVTVNTEQQDDTINVRATGLGSTLRINSHEGSDTINLSDLSPTLPGAYPSTLPPAAADSIGNIDAIDGLVVIDGGTEFDTINVDDSGNATAKAGTLTLNTLRGLALPAGVDYTGAEDFNLWFGTGADVLFIDSTHAGTTQVFGGDGNATTNERDDTVAINTIGGVTTIHGQAGNDFIEVNVDAPVLPQDATFGSLDPITGFFVRTHLNGLGAVLNLHGEGDSDQYTLNLAGDGTALVNVHDDGAPNNGADILIVNGADVVAGVTNQPNDTFLLRRDFLALLNESVPGGGFDRVERVNYDQNINARLIVNGLGGDDKIVADDNSSITTLDGGDGNDTFQIGQVFGTPRDAAAGLAPGDTFNTTPVIIGVINDPVTGAVIFDPTSFDPVLDVLPAATIAAINAAIAHQAALGLALDGIAYVSDGVNNATTAFGGDGADVFNVYHNKGTLRLEGEAGNDEFIVRAFVTVDLSPQAETEILAGGGDDTINYAINAPVSLDGGAGFDTVVVLGTPFNDNFVVTRDGIFGAGLNVTFANIESAELDALEGDDTIYILGTSSDFVTRVIGGLGSDTIEVMGDVLRTIVSDDLLGRSGVITHGATSLDDDFNNVGVSGVGVNVLSLGGDSLVSIQPTGEPLRVTEAGTLASYFISLVGPNAGALAANPVYLTVSAGVASSEDRGNGGASILVSVNGGAFTNAVVLTFDGTTASTVFEIEVMAVDDLAAEGRRIALISHSINSDDAAFDDLPLIGIFVDVVDNDKAGLDIRHLQDLAGGVVPDNRTEVLEGGATFGFDDVYSVALTAAPAVGEIVTVALNTDGQVTALSSVTGNSFLVFDHTNWNTPQLVVVTAVEDGLDGIEISTVAHQITGGAVYGGTPSETLKVTVYDDETPGVIVQETDGSTIVVDGGANDSYRVRLTRMPDDVVTLTLRTDTQTLLSTIGGFATTDETGALGFFEYTYQFTAANWYQWVDIEVTANSAFTGTGEKTKAFPPQDQNLDQIGGPLTIEGGVGTGGLRALVEPVLLPNETNAVSQQNPSSTSESGDIDTLNVFHTDNSDGDTGNLFYRTVDAGGRTIANPGLALTGFEMGDDLTVDQGTPGNPQNLYYGGGITLNGFEVVEILLGKGDETLTVADTGDRDEKDPAVTDDPATITAIHGGGGSDIITITGRGNGPLVVYGDTSEDRIRYGNDAPEASVHGTSFANDGDDTIDARLMAEQNDGFVGLVAYGGFGNDTIWGSQDDDHLAGGTSSAAGHDFIDGQAGDDHIYGDSHFNVGLQLFAEDQVQAFDNADPRVADMFRVLVATSGDDNDFGSPDFRESAGADELWGGDGADIIFGDHGVISLAQGTRRLTTTASVERIETAQPTFGGDDTLYGHSNDPAGPVDDAAGDRIFGGQAADYIDAGQGNNVVLGDHGFVDLGEADSHIDRIESTQTTFAGGVDTILTGSGNDIVIGGRFGDTITVADGTNVVLGDAGFLQYQNGGPLLGEVSSIYLDGAGAFIQGGDDTISVGVGANTGDDIVIAGLGDDNVTIGNGNNVVFGDDGSVTFQTGSTLRDRIESRYLDGAGLSALDGAGAVVGNDTIITGVGNDVVIGGLGVDGITVADGNNIVAGDEGFVQYQDQGQTGGTSVLGEVSSSYLDGAGTFVQGGIDTITVGASAGSTGAGSDTVIAGLGDDDVTIGDGDNVVFGDEGGITYQTGSGLRDLITSRYLDAAGFAALDAVEAVVGNDTISTGIGNDVIIGGLGDDGITVADGNNIVAGDEGFVQYQDQGQTGGASVLGEVSSQYLDAAGTFVQGGIDTITVGASAGSTGAGSDTVIAGLGDDNVTIGDGDNIVFGDDGGITYQTGSGLRDLITSRYLDAAGFAALDALEAAVGNDTINTGVGNDVIIAGLGVDGITVADGNNIVVGDEGFIQYQDQGQTGGTSVLGEVSSSYLDLAGTFVQGGIDTITVGASVGSTGAGSDTVIAGLGDDNVTIGDGDNVVFGDEGGITYQTGSGLRDLITSRYLDAAGFAALDAVEAVVGNDTISTGIGNDVIIGGLGVDGITVADGNNIVVGDEGFIQYQDQGDTGGTSVLGEVSSSYLDGAGTFVQGGIDTITVGASAGSTGAGSDTVIAGLGDDDVTIGDGDNIVFGDEGGVTYQTGSGLRDLITSRYLDAAGFAALDALEAAVGNDTISTGVGNDVIIGGLGVDGITVADGNNIVVGDEGFIQYQDQGQTGGASVLGEVSSLFLDAAGTFVQGGIDTITVGASAGSTGAGSDTVIAGLGDDNVTIGDGDNIVLGDDGTITYQTSSGLRDRIESRYLDLAGFAALDAPEAVVGNDTITTGVGDDLIIAGLGDDGITVEDGNNIVLGDEGFVQYQDQGQTGGASVLGEVSSLFLDGAGTFVQGGIDTISVGVGANTGDDVVIAGLGDDNVTIGDGDNVVFGDEGRITYQTGSGLRSRIESQYLDAAGLSPLDAPEAAVGDDTIITGVGNDVIIGGLGVDGITVADGNNIVVGDEGFVQYQDQGQTGGTSVLGEVSSSYLDGAGTFVQGGIDTITVGASVGSIGAGSDTVIAGLGDDNVTIGDGDNVVFGDEGGITYQTGSGLRDLITSRYLDAAGFAALDAVEAVVGNDTISTGIGNDVIIAGLGVDGITVADGNNIVVGDEGFIQYQDQSQTGGTSVLGEVSSLFLDAAGTFVQGGIDTITVGASAGSAGAGSDTVIAGLGDDDVTIGDGDNVVFGDEGGITYQTGSGLRDWSQRARKQQLDA